MSSDYYDFPLECARRLYEFGVVLEATERLRRLTLLRALSEWEGEAADSARLRQKKDDGAYATACDAIRDLQASWVRKWERAVNQHNRSVWRDAIKALQQDLDLYHANRIAKMNLLEAGVEGLNIGVDTVGDLIGLSTRADDAADLVRPPREVDEQSLPSPPEYIAGSVFVRYERYSASDPTRGMYKDYVEWPAT